MLKILYKQAFSRKIEHIEKSHWGERSKNMTLFPDILKLWTIHHSLGGVLVNMTSKTDHKVKKSGRTKWTQSFLIFRPRLSQKRCHISHKIFMLYFPFMFCSWGDKFPQFSSTPITRRKTLSRLHVSTKVLQKNLVPLPKNEKSPNTLETFPMEREDCRLCRTRSRLDLSMFFSFLFFFTYTNQTFPCPKHFPPFPYPLPQKYFSSQNTFFPFHPCSFSPLQRSYSFNFSKYIPTFFLCSSFPNVCH